MDRESLNLYIDAFLSWSSSVDTEPSDAADSPRTLLIEEAAFAETLDDLLKQWFWLYPAPTTRLLLLKSWWSLSYKELALFLGVGEPDVAQQIRNERVAMLPVWMEIENPDGGAKASCFMVEQQQSAWMDGEVADIRTLAVLDDHFQTCSHCAERLKLYRQLQRDVLNLRHRQISVTEAEWTGILYEYHRRTKKRWMRVLSVVGLCILVLGVALAWLWATPEKMPNVFEIYDN